MKELAMSGRRGNMQGCFSTPGQMRAKTLVQLGLCSALHQLSWSAGCGLVCVQTTCNS
eukprot:m.780890 g.780890  ORF g.780890 m.780890 type:complete len:58 (-) comp59141_c0_seq13:172-345(-)